MKKVTASCQLVSHSTKAASKKRGMQYTMWEYFGACAVFFTVTPDDENSFRIRLFTSCGMEQKLPSLLSTNDECIVDFNFRKRSQLSYPGACALEFESIIQIITHCIIGWDINNNEGIPGIFGIPEAYA